MSSFIDVDSYWRDRATYQNPAEFDITAKQINGWVSRSRTVRANPQNPNNQPYEFATSIEIINLTIPYTTDTAVLPRVYIDMHSELYKDIYLINIADRVNKDARFICTFDKIQNDNMGNPTWIHYKCGMEQVCRFGRDSPIKFRVFDRNGVTLPLTDDLPPNPPNDLAQITTTFKITPYIKDGDYRNSLTDTIVA